MIQPTILVTGPTGKTGAAIIDALLSSGARIRAVVRKRDARATALAHRGVEVVTADPLNLPQMRAAMDGATRAYFLPPFDPSAQQAAEVFAAAARASRLESIVLLSQWLASRDHPAWLTRQLWPIEQLFDGLSSSLTIVAPPFFADNYLRLIGFAAHLGLLPTLTGESRSAPPSTEDIAAVVVAALLDPAAHAGRRYTPTGPALLSTTQMAAILAHVLERPVRPFPMPLWLFLKAARMQNVPQPELSGFRHWVEDHRQGAFAFNLPTRDVEDVTGRSPESFERVARRYADRPEARRSFPATLRALADFMRTPLAPGYNLARYERDLGLEAPPAARFAMHNAVWRAERSTPATILKPAFAHHSGETA